MQVQDATFNKFEQDLETEKAYWKSDWKGAQRRNKIFFSKISDHSVSKTMWGIILGFPWKDHVTSSATSTDQLRSSWVR